MPTRATFRRNANLSGWFNRVPVVGDPNQTPARWAGCRRNARSAIHRAQTRPRRLHRVGSIASRARVRPPCGRCGVRHVTRDHGRDVPPTTAHRGPHPP
jgi:hypothetical protein